MAQRPIAPRRARRPRRRSRGQSLVEFTLVLPVVLVVLLGSVDLGRLYFGWVALQNTSRIGANFAATNPDAWVTPTDPRQGQYAQEIQNDASTINCALPTAIPTPNFPDPAPNQYSIGSRATVSLTCRFSLITPLIGAIVGNSIQLGATTTYPIRGGIVGVPLPTPTPTPTPTATPTATPGQCTVPSMVGMKTNPAAAAWKNAGFAPANLTISFGPNNYTIVSETPSGSDLTQQACTTFQLVVSPS